MKRFWVSIQLGHHLLGWWPFDNRMQYENVPFPAVSFMTSISEKEE